MFYGRAIWLRDRFGIDYTGELEAVSRMTNERDSVENDEAKAEAYADASFLDLRDRVPLLGGESRRLLHEFLRDMPIKPKNESYRRLMDDWERL